MNIEYCYELSPMESLEIESVGSVCIEATSDLFERYYLMISTSMGWSKVETFGPLKLDTNELQGKFYFSHIEFEYNQVKLQKQIYNFLNDSKKLIKQAAIIDSKSCSAVLKDVINANIEVNI